MRPLIFIFVPVAFLGALVAVGCNGDADKLKDLQARYDQLQTAKDKADDDLRAAKDKIHSLESDVASLNVRVTKASLPDLGIRMGFGMPDLDGLRDYATLTNDNDEAVSINFKVVRKDGVTSKDFNGYAIGGHGTNGTLVIPDWKFMSGDTVSVSISGHRTETWTVP